MSIYYFHFLLSVQGESTGFVKILTMIFRRIYIFLKVLNPIWLFPKNICLYVLNYPDYSHGIRCDFRVEVGMLLSISMLLKCLKNIRLSYLFHYSINASKPYLVAFLFRNISLIFIQFIWAWNKVILLLNLSKHFKKRDSH